MSPSAQRGLEERLGAALDPSDYTYRNGELLLRNLDSADRAFPLVSSLVDNVWGADGKDLTDRYIKVGDTHGIYCPACGSDSSLDVRAYLDVRLVRGGTSMTEARNDAISWDETSPCSCSCGWSGKVADGRRSYEMAMNKDHVPGD